MLHYWYPPTVCMHLCNTDNQRLSTREEEEKTKWNPRSVCELEDCLREVLSDVLEVEMKAAFEDLWLEVTLAIIISHYPSDYISISVLKMVLKDYQLISGIRERIKGAYLVGPLCVFDQI